MTTHEAARIAGPFISPAQRRIIIAACNGEERDFFRQKLHAIAQTIQAMPKTYETEEQPTGAKVAHLRYFAGARAEFYIVEKDSDPDGAGQAQAFGLADLYNDGGELGYISLPEIFAAGGELDLYYTPKTLAQLRPKCYETTEETTHAEG